MPLPDIDTANVSFLAFWNALDNGVSSIDPTDAESYMDTSTQYSNGVQGLKTYNGIEVKCRVKDDGWIVTWLGTGSDYVTGTKNRSDIGTSEFDVVLGWDGLGHPSLIQGTLERTLNGLRTSLSNSGNMNYNSSDVGLYDYQNTGATNILLAEVGATYGESGDSMTVTWESGTTVHRWDALGYSELGNDARPSSRAIHDNGDDDITLAHTGNDLDTEWGSHDALAAPTVAEGDAVDYYTVGGYDNPNPASALICWS